MECFRNTIEKCGKHPPEKDRYHLYVSYSCPWAHRTLIIRALKGLEKVITVTIVDHYMGVRGWRFGFEGEEDEICGKKFLKEIYLDCTPDFKGNITVPVLLDKKTKKIVNNESSEIIRILNTEFNEFTETEEQALLDFYPKELRSEIDDLNNWIYLDIHYGVYKCGFAAKQEIYAESFDKLFTSLDKLEAILANKRYLTGNTVTEADIRLWPTLARFDCCYVQHFKCNKKMLKEYPNIFGYTRDIYQLPGISKTLNLYHIKHHYMGSHTSINPKGIIPLGPDMEGYFDSPHARKDF